MKLSLASSVPAPPEPRFWEWSISEAWSWLSHASARLIHIPYLGLLSLVLAALLVSTAIARLLGGR